MGCGHPAILCSPPKAAMVEEPGFCIRWKTFITTASMPMDSRSVASRLRTTPRVASGRKAGSGRSPWTRESVVGRSVIYVAFVLFRFRVGGSLLGSGNHQNVLALQRLPRDGCQKRRERSALHIFELLGQVVGKRGGAVSVDFEGVTQTGFYAIGTFVEDEGMGGAQIHGEKAFAGAGFAGRKAPKREGMNREAGEHQRHNKPGWAGDESELLSGGKRPPHDAEPRIGDPRCSCVRHDGHRFALRQQAHNALPGARLVVFVEGDLRFLYLKTLEHQPGFARVLAGDDIGGAQRLQGAQRNIAQIADRGCDEVEHRSPTGRAPVGIASSDGARPTPESRPNDRPRAHRGSPTPSASLRGGRDAPWRSAASPSPPLFHDAPPPQRRRRPTQIGWYPKRPARTRPGSPGGTLPPPAPNAVRPALPSPAQCRGSSMWS